MAESSIRLPIGSQDGSYLRTQSSSQSGQTVQQEVHSLADPLGRLQANAYATGTITAADTSTVTGSTTGIVELVLPDGTDSWEVMFGATGSGTWSAGTVIAFEATNVNPAGNPTDARQWHSIQARRVGTPVGATTESTTTFGGATNGTTQTWNGTTFGGRTRIRFRCTAFTGGDSITVQVSASQAPGGTVLLAALPAGTNVLGGVRAPLGAAAALGLAYSASTDVLATTGLTPATDAIAFRNNNAAGGANCLIDRIVFSHSLNANNNSGVILRRYQNLTSWTAGTNVQDSTLSRTVGSTGSPGGQLFHGVAAAVGLTGRSGGTVAKAVYVATGTALEDTDEDDALIVPPGQTIVWSYQLPSATAVSFAFKIAWSERSSLA